MSSISPSVSATGDAAAAATIPPSSLATNNQLDWVTKLFLVIVFLSLFIQLCYIYIVMRREQNNATTLNSESDNNENKNPTGLPIDIINSYHSFPYSKTNNEATMSDHDTTCSICISDYEESEILRMMPQCQHYFHKDCVDSWLKVNASCPICRNSMQPSNNDITLPECV
ncbi:hypothetical protein RJT34_18059 [Clitoria ternatea]|uniref:RING-type domain-containing protein n=1 Tax=Clitoria ternatea TaxID=43366 RepID=A0AAN9JBB6_CLITE